MGSETDGSGPGGRRLRHKSFLEEVAVTQVRVIPWKGVWCADEQRSSSTERGRDEKPAGHPCLRGPLSITEAATTGLKLPKGPITASPWWTGRSPNVHHDTLITFKMCPNHIDTVHRV